MVVAIIGASTDRRKFGNKSLRAHAKRGFDVYPVNPRGGTIEGFKAFTSVLDIPVDIDRVSIYLPPETTLGVLDEIARKGTRELYLNPGSEDDRVVAKATGLGLRPILACSIVAIGESPGDYE
jgi:predicted CoA-binding protein